MSATVTYSWTFGGGHLPLSGAEDWDPVPVATPFGAHARLRDLVVASLFSDARAELDDDLPSTSEDPVYRGGWWGDTYSGEAAGALGDDRDSFGSRLWLLYRATSSVANLERARRYCEQALAWMITDGLAEAVQVVAERIVRARGAPLFGLEITISKGTATRWLDLWTDTDVG